MIAYIFLFFALLAGELRMLGINTLCRIHCFLGFASFYAALLHLISAVSDKYKWGASLSLPDYLGFNYSDKWMICMSLGAFAFYLIIFVSASSSSGAIKAFGCRRWKLLHKASYLALIMVFSHSIVLGTDLNHSDIRAVIYPLMVFSFSFLILLVVLRLLGGKNADQKKRAAYIIMALIASLAITYFAESYRTHTEYIDSVRSMIASGAIDLSASFGLSGEGAGLQALSTEQSKTLNKENG